MFETGTAVEQAAGNQVDNVHHPHDLSRMHEQRLQLYSPVVVRAKVRQAENRAAQDGERVDL